MRPHDARGYETVLPLSWTVEPHPSIPKVLVLLCSDWCRSMYA